MARRRLLPAAVLVTFWPGAVLAGLAAPAVWKARREPGARFLLAWLVPSWLVFEVVMTKLPHYVLPLYPAIAILIAGIVEGGGSSKRAGCCAAPSPASCSELVVAMTVVGRLHRAHRDLVPAWPFRQRGGDLRLFARRPHHADGPERVRFPDGMPASVWSASWLMPATFPAHAVAVPSEPAAGSRARHRLQGPAGSSSDCSSPGAERGVFLLGTNTSFDLISPRRAAELLNGGDCCFALIQARAASALPTSAPT